ncbi:hypothetical protein TNCV_2395811 [Trichonephila clavipes]|nr:hypothetical protein TNCV_2395811 [Trichonephila clavipes]
MDWIIVGRLYLFTSAFNCSRKLFGDGLHVAGRVPGGQRRKEGIRSGCWHHRVSGAHGVLAQKTRRVRQRLRVTGYISSRSATLVGVVVVEGAKLTRGCCNL